MQNSQYKYSIYARADKDNVLTTFTEENPSFNVWNQLYQVSLTTDWRKYSFDFYTPAGETRGRADIHFGGRINESLLPIQLYIDDLQIRKLDFSVDVNENETALPSVYSLSQNYPNPFNPNTMISYTKPKMLSVKLAVYDIIGRQVCYIS